MDVLPWEALVNEQDFQDDEAFLCMIMLPHLAMPMSTPLRLRVVIPHFFREGGSDDDDRYGSVRPGNRLHRSIAFARCLGSVLALNRSSQDWILNMAENKLESSATAENSEFSSVHVDINLFVTGQNWLQDVVEIFAGRLQVHRLELSDPMQLPLEAVRALLDHPETYDLSLYMEDDLVIQDPLYAEKNWWFTTRTNHQHILMPHRREPTVANAPQQLFVDGPIKPLGFADPVWASDEEEIAQGRFWDGKEIAFVKASNPHSGSFCLSAPQLLELRTKPWPPPMFVGPLETAATGTVLQHFSVLKTSWAHRYFLTLEHGNPSFLFALKDLPRRN